MISKGNKPLQTLWEYIVALEPFSSEEESKASGVVIQRLESLEKTLNQEQKELLNLYCDSIDELDSICQCEAFVKGIKFATSYLLAAILN
ncbi:MAG: hypothetical protein E7676_01615 [Ruminococcaceae bacterium]|nr:hypothetical protein [Oscillospiraceae bacterium]